MRFARHGHGDAQILDHQVEAEPRAKAAREHKLLKLGLTAVALAARHIEHVDHDGRIEAKLATDHQNFDGDQQAGGGRHVVERLHRLAGAEFARAHDRLAQMAQYRVGEINVAGFAADHNGQLAGDGALDPARDRRVDDGHALRAQLLGNGDGLRRHARTHVNDQGRLACTADRAAGDAGAQIVGAVEQHGRDDGTGRQHGDDQVSLLADAGQIGGVFSADFLAKARCRFGVDIIGEHAQAGVDQSGCHRPAHAANADDCHHGCIGLRHFLLQQLRHRLP